MLNLGKIRKALINYPAETPKLRYLRFQCRKLQETREFYQTLGMTMDWNGELYPCVQSSPTDTGAPSTAVPGIAYSETPSHSSNKSPFTPAITSIGTDSLNAGDINNNIQPKGNPKTASAYATPPTPPKENLITILGFSFRHNQPEMQDLNTMLVFEHNPQLNERLEKEYAERKKSEEEKGGAGIGHHRDYSRYISEWRYASEYILVYVVFLNKTMQRLQAKGYPIYRTQTDLDGVSFIILTDPNGLEIRVVEMVDALLEEKSARKGWFARIGYYALPMVDVKKSSMYAEELLQTKVNRKDKILALTKGTLKNAEEGSEEATTLADDDAANEYKHKVTKKGFRAVDSEEFVHGLERHSYYWCGNGARSKSTSLCFYQRIDLNYNEDIDLLDRSKSPLLSVGLEINHLESCVVKMKIENKFSPLRWMDDVFAIEKAGSYSSFYDNRLKMKFDLFTARIPMEKPKREDIAKVVNNKFEINLEGADSKWMVDNDMFAIDRYYLGGHCRFKTSGAINAIHAEIEHLTQKTVTEKIRAERKKLNMNNRDTKLLQAEWNIVTFEETTKKQSRRLRYDDLDADMQMEDNIEEKLRSIEFEILNDAARKDLAHKMKGAKARQRAFSCWV